MLNFLFDGSETGALQQATTAPQAGDKSLSSQ
jgi:hypothetical protein